VTIRYVISTSIDKLESYYTTLTILGAIGIGPLLEYRTFNGNSIVNILMFILLQVIFVYFIYFLAKYQDDIIKIIKSPHVVNRYLNQLKITNNCLDLYNSLYDLESNIPANFSRFNSFKISAYTPLTYEQVTSNSHSNAISNANDTTSNINDTTSNINTNAELLTISYKNNAAIDWIILQTMLSESWVGFSLLGVSFNDTYVIEKCIVLTGIIIFLSSYINSITIVE